MYFARIESKTGTDLYSRPGGNSFMDATGKIAPSRFCKDHDSRFLIEQRKKTEEA
jgi:hypothetical protein|tara:strand:- start:543 stop:707 length:165 start_codon:yes stop_codon:yes gene_type:complete